MSFRCPRERVPSDGSVTRHVNFGLYLVVAARLSCILCSKELCKFTLLRCSEATVVGLVAIMKINKLQRCLALQLLVCIFVEADLSETPITINSRQGRELPSVLKYSNYVQRFKRAYQPLEAARKAKLFIARTLQIFQHNTYYAEKKTSYYLTQNDFTDLTPEEITDWLHVGKGGELEPVAEARKFPDAPADSLWSVRRLNEPGEGFSKSSLSGIRDGRDNHSTDAIEPEKLPTSDSVSNLDDEALSIAIQQVRDLPDRELSKFKWLVDLKFEKESAAEEVKSSAENGIEHKAIVKSNNPNYNPLMTTSYGIWEDFEILPEHYTKYGLHEIVSDFNLEPYPTGKAPDHKVLVDEREDGLLSGLLNAIKDIYNGMDDDFNELIDDEWVDVKQPKKRVITYDIDWRKTGCISKVKSQKACNSCYAFSVISLMEYFHCRETKSLTDFSVQYVIDCGVKNGLRGCKGGKITNVGRFIRKFGIELNAMYPYSGSENHCPIGEGLDSEKKAGYLRPDISKWQNFPEIAAWYKWLPKSPLIVGINMPADFLAYGGGVHDGSNCEAGKTHAMLLVGSGKEDDKEFWLLKNSFSDIWGETGYFRLSKSAPVRCFNSAIVVRASFVK